MPKPTVTVRELHNKESGLDLSIPSQEETPGLLGTLVSYHVVVVTCLSAYKSPSHKPSDTVQFMVSRQLADFEKLQKSMAAAFPGTVLPSMPKRILGAGHNRARRLGLQDYISAIAFIPKMASSAPLLEFLGVSSMKTGGVHSSRAKEDSHDIFEEFRGKAGALKKLGTGLFDDNAEEDDDDDLFGSKKTSVPLTMDNDDDLELFKSPREKRSASLRSGSTKLFMAEDIPIPDVPLPPALGEEEEESAGKVQVEDHSKLLDIEDDLDDILKLGDEKKPSSGVSAAKPAVKPKPGPKPKPAVPPGKPKPPTKPKVAPKPKPVASEEVKKDDLFAAAGNDEEDLFTPLSNDKVSVKPSKAISEKSNLFSSERSDLFSSVAEDNSSDLFASAGDDKEEDLFSALTTSPSAAQDDLDEDLFGSETASSKTVDPDDIMRYIQENAEKQVEDLDLFS